MAAFSNFRGITHGLVALAIGAAILPLAQAAAPTHTALSQDVQRDLAVLAGYEWRFIAAYDAAGKEQKEWQVPEWGPHRVSFTASGWMGAWVCNSMNWRYALTNGRAIKIIGYGATTLAGCSEPLMSLQPRARKLFSAGFQFQLQSAQGKPPRLTLQFADGSRWDLDGEPTPLTKYGSKGEQIMLEVEAQHVACENNASNSLPCLKVRQLEWGVRDGKGYFFNQQAWQTLPLNAIDKWQHKIGWHGVLRVRKFVLKAPSDGGARVAYLLEDEYTRFSAP